MYADPGQPGTAPINMLQTSPNQFQQLKPEPGPLTPGEIKMPDGSKVNYLSGGGLTSPHIIDKGSYLPITTEMQQAATAANKIILRQANGAVQYADNPAVVGKGQKDSIASFSKDLSAMQEMMDAGQLDTKTTEQLRAQMGNRIQTLMSNTKQDVVGTMTNPSARVTVYDSKGNAFTVPASQLDQALSSGYTTSK